MARSQAKPKITPYTSIYSNFHSKIVKSPQQISLPFLLTSFDPDAIIMLNNIYLIIIRKTTILKFIIIASVLLLLFDESLV